MEFPGHETMRPLLEGVDVPRFAPVRYEPPAPTCADPAAEAREAVDALLATAAARNGAAGDDARDDGPALAAGDTVVVGLGSRGITDVVPVATAVVDRLREHDLEPVVTPAMGSHGGATPAGQVETLAGLGLTGEVLGCPIDASLETEVVGEVGGQPVHCARVAVAADGVLVVNRVKPHTNFVGPVESGVCKMATIGLGKQAGAQALHRRALGDGYVPAITEALAAIDAAVPFLGGVGIVENFYDETARVSGLPATALPDAETPLLELAREQLPTLPVDELDVLVVDRIGKDVSGAGMDPNVTGRYGLVDGPPDDPIADRIVVRGLTDASHGNAAGIGVADVTTVDVLADVDLVPTYTNALTSGSLRKVALPLAMPDDRLALAAALTSGGPYDPETARVAWIRDTGHLSTFAVSTGLVEDAAAVEHASVGSPAAVEFAEGGSARSPVAAATEPDG